MPGWESFCFSRGALQCGRQRFHPETLRNYPYVLEQLTRLEGLERIRQEQPWHDWLRTTHALLKYCARRDRGFPIR